VNLGGGVGIPYLPEQNAVDYEALAAGIKKAYDETIKPAGLDPLGIHTEWGRAITGPYGWLVARAVHRKSIYREYIGLDACMADRMRPGLYGAYHHITVLRCKRKNPTLQTANGAHLVRQAPAERNPDPPTGAAKQKAY
jgi:diaminopimelate decarboxylase